MIDQLFTVPEPTTPDPRDFKVPMLQTRHSDWCYELNGDECPDHDECQSVCGICDCTITADSECPNCGITYTADNYAAFTNPVIPVCDKPNPEPLPLLMRRERLVIHGFCLLPRGHGGRHYYPHRIVDREDFFAHQEDQ